MTKENVVSNRLIHEKSPYLLQHAHNPVNWHPWGEEAFEKAKKEDKPIFLSIGYSTCHWCHVMERESFEDQEVADLLNRHFISIKVDREERPDIDTIYMNVCQALTGHGGWPLTIVMTPDKKPFYAATYLPKDNRHGMVGLMHILAQLHDIWIYQREKVNKSSETISEYIQRDDISPSPTVTISNDTFNRAFKQLGLAFDDMYGGFGTAPKFPTPHNLYFLLRYFELTGEYEALEMAEKTLESMYRGGIYDHIGFGFARYSTDRYWLVPHFEKMLYDNALLTIAYLEAYQLTGKELYSRVAREIISYVLRNMTSSEGGFYSAEDADSEGSEGKFYIWSQEEIISVLGPEMGTEFCQAYNVDEAGNFEGKNIPNQINRLLSINERIKLETAREKLFLHREQRVHPYKDDKILTAWNGMMIAALAYAYRVLKDERYLYAAEKAVKFIFDNLRSADGRLLARYRDGEALYPAYALDYGCVIWALIELYQSSFNSTYLEAASQLNQDFINLFWDDGNGGVFYYGTDSEQLLTRPKEIYDGAIPSANSLALMNFYKLSRLTGELAWQEKAAQSMKFFGETINEQPSAYTFYLAAAMSCLNPGQEIVLVGELENPGSKQFLERINSSFMPRTLVLVKKEYDGFVNEIPFIKDMEKMNGLATVYLCQGNACQPPTNSLEEFNRQLGKQ